MAREELWPEYQSVTMTSAIQLGRTLSEGGCMVIQGWCRWTGQRQVSRDAGMMETEWAMAGVQRYRGNGDGWSDWENILGSSHGRHTFIWSCIPSRIISYHSIIQCFIHSIFCILWSNWLLLRLSVDPRTCMDAHSQLVSYHLTLNPCSSSQNSLFPWAYCRCRKRCGGVWIMSSMPSSSAISPQRAVHLAILSFGLIYLNSNPCLFWPYPRF